MNHISLVSSFFLLFFSLFVVYLSRLKTKSILSKDFRLSQKSALIIIAHPDDEIMFFTPTIKILKKFGVNLRVLCLSNGNYNGLGKVRTEEFYDVSRELGLNANVILNDSKLQDDFLHKWNREIVYLKIKSYINKYKNDIGIIFTFDESGVTKHPNHISCYEGTKEYAKENKKFIEEHNINIYFLSSYNFIFQYMSVLPFVNYLFKKHSFFTFGTFSAYKWMSLYKSQFTLIRRLHTVFSSYNFVNSFTKYEGN